MARSQIDRFRGHALAARGDSLGASFDGPARAIRCAEAIVAESDTIGIRAAALHTGECEPRDGELRGVAVDVAAEILARASPGEVLVSRTVADLVAGAKISFVDRGSHTLATVGDSWQLLAASAGEAPAQPAPGEPAMQFRREGDYWTIAFGGKVIRMRDAKGLGYLARLLRHPHREFHVLDLLTGDAPRGATAQPEGLDAGTPDAGVVLDEPAKHAYRGRIAELEAEIEQARRWNDLERAARAEAELDALTRELAGALGLRRARPARGVGQRARAGQRDQGGARRAAASRGAASRARPPPLGRRAHRNVLHLRPRPEVARHLERLRSPP